MDALRAVRTHTPHSRALGTLPQGEHFEKSSLRGRRTRRAAREQHGAVPTTAGACNDVTGSRGLARSNRDALVGLYAAWDGVLWGLQSLEGLSGNSRPRRPFPITNIPSCFGPIGCIRSLWFAQSSDSGLPRCCVSRANHIAKGGPDALRFADDAACGLLLSSAFRSPGTGPGFLSERSPHGVIGFIRARHPNGDTAARPS